MTVKSFKTSGIGVDLARPGILQVKSTIKTNTFSLSSATFTDVTGLNVSITPSSASNKVLVMLDMRMNGTSAVANAFYRILQGSTVIYQGDTAGSRSRGVGNALGGNEAMLSCTAIFLDSPATTSSVTYKVQIYSNTAAAIYVNRGALDTDNAGQLRGASSITVMEVTP
jgi:hypothetical protein